MLSRVSLGMGYWKPLFKRCASVALVIATLLQVVGCGSRAADETLGVRQERLSSQLRILGFESVATDWSTNVGQIAPTTVRADGDYALAFTGGGSATIVSAPISSLGPVSDRVSLRLRLPGTQPNPSWWGTVQLIITSESQQLYWENLATHALTNLAKEQFLTFEFPISSTVQNKLSTGTYSDLRFRILLNVPQGAGPWILDRLWLGDLNPPSGTGGGGGASATGGTGGSGATGGSGGTTTGGQAPVVYTPPDPPDFEAEFEDAVVDSVAPTGEVSGKLDAGSAVTPDGAFSYSIPIEVPEGPGGLKPEVALTYNSRGGNGLLGVGWEVTGLSRITRCRKTLAVDEVVQGVQYDSSDSFCLDGRKLMGVSGTYGANGAEYKTERADYARIVSYGAAPFGGPLYFRVWGKDGLIREYRIVKDYLRNTYDARGETPLAGQRYVHHRWDLVKTIDRTGHEMEYVYDSHSAEGAPHASEHRVASILYSAGKRAVVFEYEDNPFPVMRYENGIDFGQLERLKAIVVEAPNPTAREAVWRYELDYEVSPGTYRSRLTSVRKCDARGVCLPETTFTWQSLAEQGDHELAMARLWHGEQLDFEERISWARPIIADFNGDGRDDILYHQLDARNYDPRYQCNAAVEGLYANVKVRLANGLVPDAPLFGDPIDVSSLFRSAEREGRPFAAEMSRVGDFDGNGTIELLAFSDTDYFDGSDGYRLFSWNSAEQRFRSVPEFIGSIPVRTDWSLQLLDADGDARTDVYVPTRRSGDSWWELFRSEGGFALSEPTVLSNAVVCPQGGSALDLDDDGRSELFLICDVSDVLDPDTFESLGSQGLGVGATGNPRESLLGIPGAEDWVFGDVNGDGLDDAVIVGVDDASESEPPPIAIGVRPNTGRGFTAGHDATDVVPTRGLGSDPLRMADFNGDGRDDLLLLPAWRFSNITSCDTRRTPDAPRLFLSDGKDFHEVDVFRGLSRPLPLWNNGDATTWGKIGLGWSANQLGDFDGNGIPELIVLEGDTPEEWRYAVYSLLLPETPDVALVGVPWTQHEQIIEVSDGFGEQEVVEYADIGTDEEWVEGSPREYGEVYTSSDDCVWPQHCVKRGMTVVRRHTRSNGFQFLSNDRARSTTYGYEDGRVDVGGRGFLGFKCVTAVDEEKGAVVRTCYNNHERQPKACPGWIYPYAGLPDTVEVRSPLGDGSGRVRVTHTDYDWRTPRWMTHAVFSVELETRTVRVKEGVPVTEDLLGADEVLPESSVQRRSETRYTFDWLGNLVEELETRTAGNKSSVTRIKTEFDNHTDERWLIGLPNYREVERQRTGEAAQKRMTRIVHNANTGLLESVIVEPSSTSDLRYERTYVRGPSGLVDRIEEEAPGEAQRTTEFDYDAEGIHVQRIENAEGHVTWIGTHPALGVPVVTVDANGVTRRRKFDGFGRLRFIDEPHDGDTSIEYGGRLLADPISPGVVDPAVVRSTTAGGPESIEIRDTVGRPVREAWRAADGTFSQTETDYDGFGRASSISLPHVAGMATAGYLELEYDLLDRPLRTINPDGTQEQRTYPTFFESRIEDEEGKVTFVISDVDGFVEKSGAFDGSRRVTNSFTYFPFGSFHTATDAAGNVTTAEYDARGRRTKLIDPDAGVRKYFYNGFGELREELHGAKPTDNENFLYRDRYVYDRLGRLASKTNECLQGSQCRSDGVRRFVWDTSEHGAGLVGSASADAEGVSVSYSYDELSRPSGETHSIANQDFELRFGYDRFGRSSRIVYPEAPGLPQLDVRTHYNDFGYPDRVSSPFQIYWEALERTPEGAITVEAQYPLGGSVTTRREYSYDPLTRRLQTADSITSSAASEQIRQRLAFDFYDNGVLESRREYLEFEYGGTPPAARATDLYEYDHANRLTLWRRTGDGARRERYAFNDIGNITSTTFLNASGATQSSETYAYEPVDGSGPHAATGLGSRGYRYDKSGRLKTRLSGSQTDLSLLHTSFDLPYQATRGSAVTTFSYGPNEQRAAKYGPAGTTLYVGDLFEKRTLLGQGGAPNTDQYVFYVQAEGRLVAQVTREGGVDTTRYVHTDPLQSSTLTFDDQGGVQTRLYYAPWGQRTDANAVVIDTNPAAPITKGFTGHEHDDELGLINMRGRVYDPRLRRFASPDPLSEVPVRMPLGCLLEPCDEAEETGPVEASYGVSLTRFGGDESRYQAESSTGRGSGASSFGRGPRDSDGNELGLAELDLLTQRAGVEPASSLRFVPVTHLDSLNRYAYAYNSPVQYRDPSGYAVETIWDLANIAMGVASAGKNLATGNYAGAAVDVAGVVVDTVAAVVPGAPGGAGTAIKMKRAADAAEAAADAARQAQRAKTAAKASDKAADAADAAKKTEGAVKKETKAAASDPAPAAPAPRNAHLAGKAHPTTGVPFDAKGYPDFRAAGVVKAEVKITQTGTRAGDFAAANKAAGFEKTPRGMTWHHHQDGKTMQLVPRDIHMKTGHTGGFRNDAGNQ